MSDQITDQALCELEHSVLCLKVAIAGHVSRNGHGQTKQRARARYVRYQAELQRREGHRG